MSSKKREKEREEQWNHLEGSPAVVAAEAGSVVDPAIGGELVHQVHRLPARLALLRRPSEQHRRHLRQSNGARWRGRGVAAMQGLMTDTSAEDRLSPGTSLAFSLIERTAQLRLVSSEEEPQHEGESVVISLCDHFSCFVPYGSSGGLTFHRIGGAGVGQKQNTSLLITIKCCCSIEFLIMTSFLLKD